MNRTACVVMAPYLINTFNLLLYKTIGTSKILISILQTKTLEITGNSVCSFFSPSSVDI